MADRVAVVTGASTGIGYQLARIAVEESYALVICADEEKVHEAADKLRRLSGEVDAMVVDLATRQWVREFWQAIDGLNIDLFFANAGRALGHAFHEESWPAVKRRIDLDILQTTAMLHRVGKKMHDRGTGRILVSGSIGGLVPRTPSTRSTTPRRLISTASATRCKMSGRTVR